MLTEIEEKVMTGIVLNDYNFQNPMHPVYLDTIKDYCDVDPKKIYSTIMSLVRKGVVGADEDYAWVTQKGINYLK